MDMSATPFIADFSPAPRGRRLSRVISLLVAMVAVSLLLHWQRYGTPLAGLDEQFYLLVGDRMWQGALPYVDLWDRKPAGLFLVYAAIRALPGDGILAYQLVASLFLGATGWIVALIARRTTGWAAAAMAGCLTIGGAVLMSEGMGEAPIFYDLFTAMAVLWVLQVKDNPGAGYATWLGNGAMLLCGLAITVKTVALFEGVALGLTLIIVCARAGATWHALARHVVVWAALGILPMAAIAAFYAAIGHVDAFWFANVESILRRAGGGVGDDEARAAQLAATLILVTPLLIPAVLGLARTSPAIRHDRPVLIGWAGATFIGLLSIGYFHFHYAVPMIAPLAVLCAQAAERGWPARLGLIAVLAGCAWLAPLSSAGTRVDKRDVAALLRALPPQVQHQCLLMLEGPAIVYYLSHACLASPYAFPGHFTTPGERAALGKPIGEIIDKALAARPAAIITPATVADPALRARLQRAYRASSPIHIRLYAGVDTPLTVWIRRDIVHPAMATQIG